MNYSMNQKWMCLTSTRTCRLWRAACRLISVAAMQPDDAHTLFRLINDAHSPAGDLFFGIVTGLGDGLVVALLCSLLMLFSLRDGMAGLIAFILSGLFAQLLKRIFDMPRPPAVLDHVHVLGQTLTSHSFPSGHATSDGVMLMLALLFYSYRSMLGWLLAALFLLAAIGRIYVGVHFPLDVGAGLIIGMLTMLCCWRWSASWPVDRWLRSEMAWKIPALIVVIEAVVLGLGYRIQPATAAPLTLILPVISLAVVIMIWKGRQPVEQ